MALEIRTTSGRRAARTIDVLVAVWVVLWVAVGALVAWNLWQLRQISTTMDSAAESLVTVADGLDIVAAVPLIGDEVEQVAVDVRETATETERSARASRGTITQLSWIVGTVVFVIPVVPVLAVYVPWRRRRRREVDQVRRALRDGNRTGMEEFLAWRAMTNLPFDQLQAISRDPWNDLVNGRHRKLADGELERLGLLRSH